MDDSVIQAGVDSFLAGEKANKEAALRNNFVNSSGTSPDDFAKQIALSKATNIPIQSLMADPVEAAKHRALVNTDFSGLVTSSPLTADFLLDPKNAGIARDDTDSLSAMEQTGNFLKSSIGAFGAAIHGINTGGWGLAQAASENFVEPISGAFGSGFGTSLTAYIQRLRKASEADYATTQNFGGELSEMGAVKRGFFNAVSSAVQSTLTLPAALEFKMAEGGLALSSAIRAIAPLGAVQGGLAYTEARDKGVGKGTSLAYAGAQAATEVWTELLPMGRLIKDLGVGAPLWGTLRNQLVTENVGEQFATHFQDLNTWLTVNPEKTLKDYLNERPNAALETLIATTFATGMQTTAAHLAVRSMQQSNTLNRAAENGATQTEEMFAAAARSLVGQRSPETLKAFLEHLAPDATVLVDSTKLSEVLAQTGVDIGVLPTAQAQLENPEFVGAGVEIPYSELITGLVGTEAEKAIIPHLRFDANMPTLAEAQEYDTQAAAFFQQEADRILTEESKNQEFMDGAQAVQDDLFNQLSAVGRNGPQVNNGYAKLGTAFYSVLAKEFGVTPLQIRDGWTDAAGVVHRGYALKIGGEPNAVAGLSQLSPQTETPEFKNWFGDSKVVDASGKPLVVYHGTRAGGFDTFKPNVRKGEQLGFGIHFAVDEAFARKYATDPTVARKGKNPQNYTTYLKAANPLLADAIVTEGSPEFALAKKLAGSRLFTMKDDSGKLTAYMQNAIDATSPQRAEKLIRDAGYDAVRYIAKVGTQGMGAHVSAKAQSWIVFEPTQIKSATGNRGTFDPNDPNIFHQTFQTVTSKQTDAYRADVAWTDTGEENGFPTWKSAHVELANPRDVTEGHDIFYLPKEDARAVKYDIKAPDGRTVGHTVLEVSDGWPTMLLDIETNPGERGNRYAEYTVAAIANDVGELAVWHIVPEARSWWERQGTAPVDEFNGALTFNDYADARASRENPRGVGGNVAFNQTESAPLGSFSPETLDLNLLAGANYTTFVHELGHFFLTAYADIAAQEGAPKKIVDDMNAMLAQFGIADLATWNAMSLEDQRQYHEQIAESFEQYVFTGKAPSLELQPLFSTMLSWFKRVYQSLKDFVATHSGAKLNPELSAVFDRMLATDAEIASANEARGYVALFKDAAEAGMSDKDFAAYTALADAQREDAESMLRTRSLRDMKWLQARRNKIIAELQKDAAEKRADMRKTVAAEVRAEPIRQAERYLKHGVILNDVGSDVAPLGPNKLQISEVRDLYPAEALTPAPDWTKLGYGKYGMLAEVGLSPAEVAERFGLPSGPDLVETLLAQQPLNAEIESRTDQRMLEAYGDITAPDVLARAADEAIHNDFRTRAVATELSALAANIGAPSVLMKAAKEYARQVLETKTSKTIRPWSYAAAETRAGKAAMAALKKGDRETAAIEKRTELVNHVTAKEAYAVEKEIKKIVDRFKKLAAYNNESSAVKSRDFATVQAVRSLLADHGIGSKGDAAQDYLETVKENDPIAAQRLQDILAVTGENPKDWADIKLADLREFSVAIDDLWFAAARTRQMEVQGKLVAQQDVADELLATLVEQGIPTRVPGEGWAPTKTEKLGMKFGAAKAVLRRMEFVANVLDGNRTVGPWLKNIVGVIQDATAAMNVAKGETLKTFESLLDTVRPSLKRGEITAPELGYIFGKGPSGSGRAELLHAILHTGNESNMRKMLLGREWAVELPNGALDTTKWDSFVARMKQEGRLTKADYDFAQGVWNLMDSLKPAAQKAHRAVFGKFFSEVTAKPFTNEFGTYAGGYVPALTDSDIVKDNELRKLREDAFQGMEFSFPAPVKGFTNARVEGYTRALKLDLGSLNSHISQVLLFSHMAVPVSDVQRVLARPEISGAINRLYPSMLKATIIPWLNRVAKNTTSSTSADFVGLGRFLRTARSNAGVNTMMGSLSNSIQQLVGILPASVAIEGKYLRRAVVYNLTSPGETAEYVKSLSPYMQTRMDNEAYAALDNIDQILTNPNVYESTVAWTRRHAYFMQSAVDNFLSPTIWIAAYNQALEKDVSQADAVHIADSLIRQTQGASGAADVATFEAGHPFMQLFTQFTGYFNMMAQFLHGQMVKNMASDVGLPKKYARAFYIVGIGFFAQAVAAELVSMLFRGGPEDDDKDGSTIDEWLVQLGVMAPLKFMTATVPFLGTALQVSINKWNNKSYDDKMMNSPAISTLEQGLGAPVAAYKAVFEEGKPSTAIRGFAGIIGLFTGLPTALAARPVGYLADVVAGKVEPTSTPDMVRGIITGTASPDSKQ